MDDKILDDIQKEIEKELALYSEYKGPETKAENDCWTTVNLIKALRNEKEACKIYKKELEDTLHDLVKERKDKKVLIKLAQRTQGIAEMVMPNGIINPTTLHEDVSRVLKKVKE